MSSSPSDAAASLRKTQAPLKEKYKSDPSAAFVTLSSSGSLDPINLTCSMSSASAAKRIAGLHKAAGGKGPDVSSELCSGDMLLESLVACFGVTIRAVGTALAIPIQSGTVTAEGDLDFRGTLGIKDAEKPEVPVPVGFQAIRLTVRLEVEEEYKDKIEKLISLSERYCVVLQTLRAGVSVETKLGHVGPTLPNVRKDSAIAEADQENGAGEERLADDEVLPLN